MKRLIREAHEEFGYDEVKTPNMSSCELFEVSGHLEKFKENMFLVPLKDAKEYVLRPMSCPNHIQIYKKGLKSYAQLPFKLFEFGEVARNDTK